MRPIPPDAHWRDSARSVKFFFIDSSAAFPFLFFLLHIEWWTFYTCVLIMFALSLLNRYGFTVPVFFRFIRLKLAGSRKIAKPWWG